MADVTITYKGNRIAEMSASGNKLLQTAGHYCEDDIRISYVKSGGGDSIDLGALLQGYIKTDGTVETVSWYYCTDYIPISDRYYSIILTSSTASTSTARLVCFYNSSKEKLTGTMQAQDSTADVVYSIPSGAAYLRLNCSPGNVDRIRCKYGNVK